MQSCYVGARFRSKRTGVVFQVSSITAQLTPENEAITYVYSRGVEPDGSLSSGFLEVLDSDFINNMEEVG